MNYIDCYFIFVITLIAGVQINMFLCIYYTRKNNKANVNNKFENLALIYHFVIHCNLVNNNCQRRLLVP